MLAIQCCKQHKLPNHERRVGVQRSARARGPKGFGTSTSFAISADSTENHTPASAHGEPKSHEDEHEADVQRDHQSLHTVEYSGGQKAMASTRTSTTQSRLKRTRTREGQRQRQQGHRPQTQTRGRSCDCDSAGRAPGARRGGVEQVWICRLPSEYKAADSPPVGGVGGRTRQPRLRRATSSATGGTRRMSPRPRSRPAH